MSKKINICHFDYFSKNLYKYEKDNTEKQKYRRKTYLNKRYIYYTEKILCIAIYKGIKNFDVLFKLNIFLHFLELVLISEINIPIFKV